MILPPRQYARLLLVAALVAVLYGCGAAVPVQPAAQKGTESSAQEDAAATEDGVDAKAVGAFKLGTELIEKGDLANAETVLSNATEQYPDLPGPYANLGMVLEKKEDYQDAEIALRRAIELAPDKPEPYNHLGIVYRRQGKFQQALEMYKKGLKIAPDHKNLLRNTGILLELYLNSPKAALEYYQRYLEQVPDDREVQIWIADINHRSGG